MGDTPESIKQFDELSRVIARTIEEHLARSKGTTGLPRDLRNPVLRVDAFLEDQGSDQEQEHTPSRPLRLASSKVNLIEILGTGRPHDPIQQEKHDKLPAVSSDESEPRSPRRRGTGKLRVSNRPLIEEDVSEHQRQIATDTRSFPKRRKITTEKFVFRPSTLDKLIIGIWEQIHGTLDLNPQIISEQYQITLSASSNVAVGDGSTAVEVRGADTLSQNDAFHQMNTLCRKVTQASKVFRSIEIVVQAKWVELFEEKVQASVIAMPKVSKTKHHKKAFVEACQDFGWSEKELRNKMAIWRGYKEVKDAAGWSALVFAGMGIYRFCKYRVEFTNEAMKRLQTLRTRLEVAADTLHPNWRQLLSIVGESSQLKYPGHQHDWVVSEDGAPPVPLRSTYISQGTYFEFEQLEESIIDERAWRGEDPRWVPQNNAMTHADNAYVCAVCGQIQSDDAELNSCNCFPNLFGHVKRRPPPVQIYRTTNGQNNGVVALAPFERGAGIGEYVGLITKGVRHVDVMDSSTATANYQIWQGRQGNFTRFINHSCKGNAQFTQFTWLDTQHVVLVSKGIGAGVEISVDYGDRYWAGLEKSCLCGESCCRYRRDNR
ncbi:SET domain-containing protein [Bimuria novae-zelandiae CBS 107.79]|uniref:SET domain-containing protein n=1 Tax=Bimuria novae-zelandiae CBS 107.79 TaxID=1447943 RepID=A0A6A5UQD1_9PLEO|nr:SET domain-containing protein [Bimuria novae-zelandiae CBS 107.79]